VDFEEASWTASVDRLRVDKDEVTEAWGRDESGRAVSRPRIGLIGGP
jgi:hypothetical protein